MGDNAVHAVANGGDARDGAGEEIRQISRVGAARVRREIGAIRGDTATGNRGGRDVHSVYGDGRAFPEEGARDHMPRLQTHQGFLLDRHLRFL